MSFWIPDSFLDYLFSFGFLGMDHILMWESLWNGGATSLCSMVCALSMFEQSSCTRSRSRIFWHVLFRKGQFLVALATRKRSCGCLHNRCVWIVNIKHKSIRDHFEYVCCRVEAHLCGGALWHAVITYVPEPQTIAYVCIAPLGSTPHPWDPIPTLPSRPQPLSLIVRSRPPGRASIWAQYVRMYVCQENSGQSHL